MGAAVNTHTSKSTSPGSTVLKSILETGNIFRAGDEARKISGRGILGAEVRAEVTSKTAGIIAKSIGTWVLWGCGVCRWRYRPGNN
jgi:hypothetical protein